MTKKLTLEELRKEVKRVVSEASGEEYWKRVLPPNVEVPPEECLGDEIANSFIVNVVNPDVNNIYDSESRNQLMTRLAFLKKKCEIESRTQQTRKQERNAVKKSARGMELESLFRENRHFFDDQFYKKNDIIGYDDYASNIENEEAGESQESLKSDLRSEIRRIIHNNISTTKPDDWDFEELFSQGVSNLINKTVDEYNKQGTEDFFDWYDSGEKIRELVQDAIDEYKEKHNIFSLVKEEDDGGGGDGGDSMSETKKVKKGKLARDAVKNPNSLHKLLGIDSDKKLLQKIMFALSAKKVNEGHDEFGRKLYKDKFDGFGISNQDSDFDDSDMHSSDFADADAEYREETKEGIVSAMSEHMLHHAKHGTKPEDWDALDLIDDIAGDLSEKESFYIEDYPENWDELLKLAIIKTNSVLAKSIRKESKFDGFERDVWEDSTEDDIIKKMKNYILDRYEKEEMERLENNISRLPSDINDYDINEIINGSELDKEQYRYLNNLSERQLRTIRQDAIDLAEKEVSKFHFESKTLEKKTKIKENNIYSHAIQEKAMHKLVAFLVKEFREGKIESPKNDYFEEDLILNFIEKYKNNQNNVIDYIKKNVNEDGELTKNLFITARNAIIAAEKQVSEIAFSMRDENKGKLEENEVLPPMHPKTKNQTTQTSTKPQQQQKPTAGTMADKATSITVRTQTPSTSGPKKQYGDVSQEELDNQDAQLKKMGMNLGEAAKTKKDMKIEFDFADPNLLMWFMNNKHLDTKPMIRRAVKRKKPDGESNNE